jgi:transcriptional regulator with XRE-family HTH domain
MFKLLDIFGAKYVKLIDTLKEINMESTYFAQNLKHLRRRSSITQEQLGNEINLGRTTIANYESGVSGPTDPEVLIRLSKIFRVTIDELLTQDLSMAFSPGNSINEEASLKDSFNEPVTRLINNKKTLYETSDKLNLYMGTPQVIVVDNNGDEKMIFVSISEEKNYLTKREDPDYIASLPYYSLPRFSDNTYRIFEVQDNAMEPKFSYGDKVVASWVLNMEDIRDGNVYLLVTKSGILLRRVINKLRERKSLQLISDTLQYKDQYPLLELSPDEIYEVWLAEYVISSNLNQPIQNVYGKIADLETKLHDLYKSMQKNNTP